MKKIVFTKVIFMIMLVIFTLNSEGIKADNFNVEIRGEGIGIGRATTGKTYTYRLERTIGYPQELVKDLVWTVTHGKIQGANTNKLNVDVIWDKGEFSGTITCANVFKDQENPKITVSESVNLETIIVYPDIKASIYVSNTSPELFSRFNCSINYTLSGNKIEYIKWSTGNNIVILSGQGTNTIEAYYSTLGSHTIECEIKLIGVDKKYKVSKTVNVIGANLDILGPSFICPSTSSSFVVQGLPSGSSINWSTTNGLTIISGQNSSTVNIQSKGTTNTSRITATITQNGSVLETLTKDIRTNKPYVESVSGTNYVTGFSGYYAAEPVFPEELCDYEWIVGGGKATIQSNRNLATIYFDNYGNYKVGCRIINSSCVGAEAPEFMDVFVGSQYISTYNESAKTITIHKNSEVSNIQNIVEENTTICELYNTTNGSIVIRKVVNKDNGVIDISNIPKGFYILKIQINNNKYETNKIIIK